MLRPYRGKSNIAASKCRISLKPCGDYVLKYSLPFWGKFRLPPVPELWQLCSDEKDVYRTDFLQKKSKVPSQKQKRHFSINVAPRCSYVALTPYRWD